MDAARSFLNRLGLFTQASNASGADYWRERIYNYMLSTVIFFGFFALVPSVWLSFDSGLVGLGVFDILAYLLVAALFYARRFGYELRAAVFLVLVLTVGIVVFYETGDAGAGLFWLFAVPPLASLLVGLRWGMIFFAINVLITFVIGYLVISGFQGSPPIADFSVENWMVYSVNFLVTNALVTLPLGALLGALTKANLETKESGERTRLIIDTSLDAIVTIDSNSVITGWNAQAEKILGWTSQEAIGQHLYNLIIPPRYRDAHRRGLKKFLETGEGPVLNKRIEIEALRQDGHEILVELAISALKTGETISFSAFIRDTSKSKQTEERLRLSDQILQHVKTLVIVIDSDQRVIYASPSVEEVTGYSPQEVLGDGWWQLSRKDPASAQKEREGLRRAMLGETPFTEKPYERPIQDRSGVTHWIEWQDVLGPDGTLIGVGHDITERKLATEKVRAQLDQLRALGEIDRAILSTFDLQLNLQTLLKHVVVELEVDAANIMLFHPLLQTLESISGYGFRTKAFEHRQIRLGEGNAGLAALERRIVRIDDLGAQADNPRLAKALVGEGFFSYFGVPLIAKAQVRGVIEIFHRQPMQPDEDWLELLSALASRAAIAIDTVQVFENLQKSNADLTLSYNAAIQGWSRALDLRDKETEGHSQRVTDLALALAQKMGMKSHDLIHFRRGALLHDIGKMGIPDSILFKPGKLTKNEWEIMKRHPVFAREMLGPIKYLQEALDIPVSHHEKWDGSGYPLGLKGEQISLAARVFAVIDVYDALTSDRPYRKAWTRQRASDYIKAQSGKHFDPGVVDAFLELDLPQAELQTVGALHK